MDNQTRVIAAEAAVTAILDPPRRRFFSRRRKSQPPPLPYCENCKADMSGPFCSQCGQHAIDYRRSFGRVVVDALDSFLNWDSRFFATIGLLLVMPWRLTKDFLAGKRVRYVHPLRLYLLVSIVFFFGVHVLAKSANIHTGPGHREMNPEEKAKIEQKISKLPPDAQTEVRAAMDRPRDERSFLEVGTDGQNPNATPFEKWMNERVKTKIGENGVNVKVFFLTLVDHLPAMMLCCIPLFALVLKVLYIRKRLFYIDHLIYSLHIHAFAYLVIMIVGFGSWGLSRSLPAVQPFATAALILAAVALLLISIRRVYRQGWFISVIKFLLGGVVYTVVVLIAVAATLFATLALPD